MDRRYPRLVRTLLHNHPRLMEFALAFPQLSLLQRKLILTVCRVQQLPHRGTTIERRLRDELRTSILWGVDQRRIPLRDAILSIPELESPVLSGLFSMLVRWAPPEDREEIKDELAMNIRKELSIAQTSTRPVEFIWSSIFSYHRIDRSTPISPRHNPNFELAGQIHEALHLAKLDISRALFYPDSSQKTMGQEAKRTVRRYRDILWDIEDWNSTSGLEILYGRTGIELEGETEVRWAWKYNDLKPRVYYARGPSHYYASRYIQEIFNIFVDALPISNRFQRFFTSEIQGRPMETAFTYDYSSFTSTLDEIRNFTSSLAEFCSGTIIHIFDTHQGLIRVLLSDLIDQFNDSCNHKARFTTDGLPPDFVLEENSALHHSCGMLGVPGNISSCTLLHAIHFAFVLGALDKGKVVGDDAFGWALLRNLHDRQEMVYQLSSIGSIALDKMEFWGPEPEEDLQRWHYTKRPAERSFTRIETFSQVQWPSIPVILNLSSEDGRTFFPLTEPHMIARKTSSMLLAFVLQPYPLELSEVELDIAREFVYQITRSSNIWEVESTRQFRFVRPFGFTGFGDKLGFLEQFLDEIVQLPRPWDHSDMPERLEHEIWVFARPSRLLKMGKMMKWIDSKREFLSFRVCDRPELFDDYLSKSLVSTVSVYVNRNCPSWYFDMLQLQMTAEKEPTSPSYYVEPDLGIITLWESL